MVLNNRDQYRWHKDQKKKERGWLVWFKPMENKICHLWRL